MEDQKSSKSKFLTRKTLYFVLKLAVSVFAIYYVVRLVGGNEIISTVRSFGITGIILASLIYLLSQYISSIRLLNLLHHVNIGIGLKRNFLLYLVGMSYNLFLPTGIGGDGYKFLLLHHEFKAPKKVVFKTLLFDRLFGLLAIVFLLSALLFVSQVSFTILDPRWYLVFALGSYIVGFVLSKRVGAMFHAKFNVSFFLSVIIQAVQIVMICFIANRLGVTAYIPVAIVFLLSTLATTIPVFLGGVGAREMVFAFCSGLLGVPSATLVSIALIFSFCTVLNALPGLVLDWAGTVKVQKH